MNNGSLEFADSIVPLPYSRGAVSTSPPASESHSGQAGLTLDILPSTSNSLNPIVKATSLQFAELDVVALVLAGGRGSRLGPLTQSCCKPAVPFGAGARIIDYTLSNCVNSGIGRMGIITQYEQNSLIQHIQQSWGFLQNNHQEFVDILPVQPMTGADFYTGTADAVFKNRALLEKLSPRFTLVLAGDHIYKADYRRMIRHHIANKADLSIACCTVPLSQAHNFGIVSTNSYARVVDFNEKPACPIPLLTNNEVAYASMGFYLFNTECLLESLFDDRCNPDSVHDFARDIVPSMLDKQRVVAYDFESAQPDNYWRDVGTLDTYFEANMQLLRPDSAMNTLDENWPIHCHSETSAPARFIKDSQGYSGLTTDSIIAPACVVKGAQLRHCILYTNVHIDEQSIIENTLLMPGVRIGKRCRIRNAIINSDTQIPDDTHIGYGGVIDTLRHTITDSGVVVVSADRRVACSDSALPSGAKTRRPPGGVERRRITES